MLELIFYLWFSFVFVEHDMFFASNGNWEKIRAPDGIRTDDPPWSSRMLTPWRARVKCGSLTRTASPLLSVDS